MRLMTIAIFTLLFISCSFSQNAITAPDRGTCTWTEPIRIAGDGTGQINVRLDVYPPKPLECGPLRIITEILYIADENPAGETVAMIQFKVNSDHYEHIQLGNIQLGTGYNTSFIVACEAHNLVFAWRLIMSDEPDTYAVGDTWWWQQVID